MSFGEPQCVEIGSLQLSADEAAEEIFVEPESGRLWLLGSERQRVFVLDTSSAESALKRQAAQLETRSTALQHIFTLHSDNNTPESPPRTPDEILTVLFPTLVSSSDDGNEAAARTAKAAVLVTHRGALIVRSLDNPTERGVEWGLPVQNVSHSLALPCDACAGGFNILACTRSGSGCEVFALSLRAFAHRGSDDDDDDGAKVRQPSVRGLFRVTGSVASLLFDRGEMVVLCITAAGAVDVWSWIDEEDVTTQYRPIEYDVSTLGAPAVGAALVAGGHVWIGTESGSVVRLPIERAANATAADASPPTLLASCAVHRGAVGRLLLMSLGTRVWSCGVDGKVCVWDTASGQLSGSFLFSAEPEDSNVTACPPLVVTPLWGVHKPSASLSSFNVLERLAGGAESLLTTPACERAHQAQLRESNAMRIVLQRLMACSIGTARDSQEAALAAADSLEEPLGIPVRDLLHVVADARACRDTVHRYLSARHRQHVDGTTISSTNSLRAPVQQLVTDAQRLWQLEDEVSSFLRQVAVTLSPSTPLESLDDVRAAVQELHTTVKKRDTSSAAQDSDTVAAEHPDGGATSAERQSLERALELERQLRLTSEKALSDMTEENRELSRRVELLTKQVERSEDENDVLKRSLLAARKAAEAQSSEAAKLYGLEARLRESEAHHQSLEEEVTRLRGVDEVAQARAAQVTKMQATLDTYSQKELLARRAIADFLRTQSDIDKHIQQLGEFAASLYAPSTTSTAPSAQDRFESLLHRTLDLEETIDEILHQQKTYIADLKHDLLL